MNIEKANIFQFVGLILSILGVGTIISNADIQKIGRTSIKIGIEAWVLRSQKSDKLIKVTEGVFTFVAIDKNGKPREVPNSNYVTSKNA